MKYSMNHETNWVQEQMRTQQDIDKITRNSIPRTRLSSDQI
jgi:hypothetical protein